MCNFCLLFFQNFNFTENKNPNLLKKKYFSEIKEDEVNNVSLKKATLFATLASSWCKTHQGIPISHLPLYSLTISEVLRLHLLTSGARVNDSSSAWRYSQRGGYISEDDPGLHLRLRYPHILKALAVHNVVQLPISDKLRILSCLISQLLTYADVRDLIEDRLEAVKQAKHELKTVQTAERKRQQEYITAKLKLKRDENVKNLEAELQRLERDANNKQYNFERKVEDLIKSSNDNIIVLG